MLKAEAKLQKKQYEWKVKAAFDQQQKLDTGPPIVKAKKPPKTIHIDEGAETPALQQKQLSTPAPHLTADQGHEKTQKLRDALDLNKSLQAALKKDVAQGKITDIPGVAVKKKAKGLFGKLENLAGSVGSHIVHGTTGDVVGKVLDLISRPQNAIASEVVDATGTPTADNPTAGFNKRVDWKSVHAALDKAAKSQGWSDAKKQAELAKFKAEYHSYEPGDKEYVDPEINALGLSSRALRSAKKGLQGKEHHSIGEITIPAAQNIPLLHVGKNDPLIARILKQAPGVAAGFVGDVATDPLSYGGGVGTTLKGLSKAPEAGTEIAHASAAPKLIQHSEAYSELLRREQAVDEATQAYKESKSAAKLRELQKMNKDLEEYRKTVVPTIKADASAAGLTHEEINSLGIGKSVESRMMDFKNPPAGSITKDAHTAAKEILD
jgi:hypothetical protein